VGGWNTRVVRLPDPRVEVVPAAGRPGTVLVMIGIVRSTASPSRKGFTLLELIAVVIVLAILAGLAVLSGRAAIIRTQDSSTRTTLASVHRDARAIAAVSRSSTPYSTADTEAAIAETPVIRGTSSASGGHNTAVALAIMTGTLQTATIGYSLYGTSDSLGLTTLSPSGNVCYAKGNHSNVRTWCGAPPAGGLTGPALVTQLGSDPVTGGGTPTPTPTTPAPSPTTPAPTTPPATGTGGYTPIDDGTPPGQFPSPQLWLLSSQYTGARKWVAEKSAAEVSSGKITAADRQLIVDRISNVPTPVWIMDGYSEAMPYLQAVINEGKLQSKIPVLVITGLVNYQYCSSGAPARLTTAQANTYRAWIDQASSIIGTERTVVVLEPGAVQLTDQGCRAGNTTAQTEWSALIRYAAQKFATVNTTSWVYLDGGISAPGSTLDFAGHTNARVADLLNSAGVGLVRGFVTNSWSAAPTAEAETWATTLNSRLNATYGHTRLKYIIDTSRNGGVRTATNSCNREGTRVGAVPALRSDGKAEVWFWVKVPGEADSTCPTVTPDGEFSSTIALGLLR
jgi:prepilin-type N-terminal cleavage/methylation domain-containing protein